MTIKSTLIPSSFARTRLIFWYVTPIYFVPVFDLLLFNFTRIGVLSYTPPDLIIGAALFYFLGGYLLSGLVTYMIIGDKSNLRPLIRAVISFVLLVFGTMISAWIYGETLHPIFVDVTREARLWFDTVIEVGGGLSSQILMILQVMFIWSMLALSMFLVWSIAPLFALLILMMQSKHAKD